MANSRHKLILGLVILAAFLAVSCKKDDPKPKATPTLPEQPPLEPIEDDFQEPDTTVAAVPADPQYGLVAGGPYTLQIQLLQSKSAAERVASTLKNAGIPAYVAYVINPTPELSGTFYRVRAGSFATTAAARKYGEINLKPLGRDYWVDLKARDSEPVEQVFTPRAPAPAPTPAVSPVSPTPSVRAPEPARVIPPAPPAPAPVPPVAPTAPAPAPAAPSAPPPMPPAPSAPAAPPAPPADTGSVEDW